MSDTPATFTAYDVAVDGGAKVSVTASTLEQFLATLGKLGVGVNTTKDKPATTQPKPTAEKPKAEKTATEGQSSAASAGEASAAKPQADASQTKAAGAEVEPMPYEQLQKVVFALAGKDRQAVVDLMAQFGVTHFKTLAAERIADAHAAVSAKLAELEVA